MSGNERRSSFCSPPPKRSRNDDDNEEKEYIFSISQNCVLPVKQFPKFKIPKPLQPLPAIHPRMAERLNVSLDGTRHFMPMTPNRCMEFRSPLSTKREREKCTPAERKAAPKMFKTAPQTRSVYSAMQDLRPRQVTLNGGTELLSSPHYSPSSNSSFVEQVFTINAIIGKGSYGEVFEATCHEDRKNYAIKISINQIRASCPKKFREVENHIRAGSHVNIVELKRAWTESNRLYIQTELCDYTLLYYCTQLHVLPENEIWDILIDLTNAVAHLHARDLLHDDIKPENVFMTADKVCKLGDFGLCINLRNPTDLKLAEEGDSKYLAKEVLNDHPTKASDIFSLGVTILEAATDMDLPSNGQTWHEIREGKIPDRFFSGISTDLRDIITWMLHEDPKRRPSASDLLEHSSIRRRLFKRKLTILKFKFVSTILSTRPVQGVISYFFLVWTWMIAFITVVLHSPAANLIRAVADRRRIIAANYGQHPIPNYPPMNQHTPIQSPEGTSKVFSESMCLQKTSPYNFSDEENSFNSSPRSPRSPNSQRRLFPEFPPPILNLDDDDDEEPQATSSSNSSAISMSSPIRSRSSPQKAATPKSARKIFGASHHGGSGDGYPNVSIQEEQHARYERMLIAEQRMDSDDNDNVVNEAAVLMAPPVRFRRTRRMPAPPDFSCLDESPKKRNRMLSSSGDDEM